MKSGRQTSIAEVGDTIVQMAPDVIALQEIDVNEHRSGEVDQVTVLAARLGYQAIYAATLAQNGGTYGIAVLSRLPIQSVKRTNLRVAWNAEPRVAVDTVLCAGGQPLRVVTAHADVWTPTPNLELVAGLLDAHVTSPTIVLGDFNETPDKPGIALLASHGLVDLIGKYAEGPSFWGSGQRIDYLFVDATLLPYATGAHIGTSHASDHYPVWADFDLSRWPPPSPPVETTSAR